ncbi:uncharacterized protein LOC120261734 isoform X1 [Dioscorea cayenensis subsp. rotundata]|uniref:Uncharacterized protein LOC120261734 isoform X1 n=1 Tax=Dioscorea cayennensis subsp. rotundata TaxID=55577 RepID=A0AB40BEU3_DIOCR|nr:uncharacterized protein LOC120261734 isoform X1 [Dioscorea cayenensis subsp. rotundata]
MMAVTSRSGEEGGVKREGSAVDEYRSPPSRVTFPDAALRMSGSSTTPPLLKLQVEESSESMNPNNMWQVMHSAYTNSVCMKFRDIDPSVHWCNSPCCFHLLSFQQW